jgi:hypothetical protein
VNDIVPLPGFLLCETVTESVTRHVTGLGNIEVASVVAGLYIPPPQHNPTEGKLLVVRRVGESPAKWSTRWLRRTRTWNTSFEEQKIDVGTLLNVRKVAGKSLDDTGTWWQIRYDEVCAVGVPFDEEYPVDMRPAPGWVGVQLDELPSQRGDGLIIKPGIQQVVEDGQGTWGRVVALPRGVDVGLSEGDRVLIPTHEGVGATEFIEYEGGIRFLPADDVLAVEGA